MSMVFGSVCSGIEVASVAWHALGWRTAFVSEIEAFPCAVLAHHYPHTPNLGDMTRFEEWPDAAIDLLVGGTPCQSFSVAGLRKGLADPRGNLMLVFGAIARRYWPRWLVWENVPGVLSSNGGRDFGAFLGMLGELGYGFAYRILDAQFFGVPQRRRRVFVVGCLGDWRAAAAVLFERASLRGDSAPRREAREDFAGTLAGGARRRGGYSSDDVPHVAGTLSVAPAITSNPYGDHVSREGLLVAHTLRGEGFDASEDGTGRGVPLAFDCKASGQNGFGCGDVASTLRAMGHTRSNQNAGGHLAVAFGENSRGEVCESEVTRSLAGQGDKAGQGFAAARIGQTVRRLTTRECERLQGLPDDYTAITLRGKPAADGPRYKALGNSMAVPVMRWIGERIRFVDMYIGAVAA